MKVRTRFAPSPTGFMHVGNLRTALYAWLWAKKNDGVFMLRIEDTDQARFVEGAEEMVYKTLRTAGLTWDEGPDVGGDYGPYVQSERKDMYLPYAKQLVEMGKAYYCFCTKEELDERRAAVEAEGGTFKYDKHCLSLSKEEVERRIAAGEPYVIRQNVPTEGKADFDDAIFGHIEVDCSELDDMILIKADGMPTYNFANVIDDHTMGISHVLRGMEYLSSTPKYNLLYEAFGWEKPTYVHLTTIMRDATHKLSKRDGDATFEDLVNLGYLPEAIINYLALVGWSPGDEREFFTLDELKEAFSLEGLSKSPAIFDHNKLKWMNAEYIRRMDGCAYFEKAKPWLCKAGVGEMAEKPENEEIFIRILQPRTEVFSDIAGVVDFLAKLDEDYDIELFTNKKSKTDPAVSKTVLESVIPLLEALPDWTETALHDTLIGYAAEKGMKNGTLLWPVRIAMSGRTVTPGGAIEIAALLGREETLRRLRLGLEKLSCREKRMKTLYLAGGCFWGTQRFFDQFDGVKKTETGYANGPTDETDYKAVCASSGHAETVKVDFDENEIGVSRLMEYYFMIIDPTSVNKQGEDEGVQYRTGVYYEDESLLPELKEAFAAEERKIGAPLMVELMPLMNFCPAEEYHQKYLEKNPTGYCHIAPWLLDLKK